MWEQYSQDVQTIADKYPFDDSDVKPLQYQEWASEGLGDAMDSVYQGELELL